MASGLAPSLRRYRKHIREHALGTNEVTFRGASLVPAFYQICIKRGLTGPNGG